ncbi:MAG: PH domain-containing protein [Bacteroidales bacterium]
METMTIKQYMNLAEIKKDHLIDLIGPILAYEEDLQFSFKCEKAQIFFTNKRIILMNYLDDSGNALDITSIFYTRITLFSLQTSDRFKSNNLLKASIGNSLEVDFSFTQTESLLQIAELIAAHLK